MGSCKMALSWHVSIWTGDLSSKTKGLKGITVSVFSTDQVLVLTVPRTMELEMKSKDFHNWRTRELCKLGVLNSRLSSWGRRIPLLMSQFYPIRFCSSRFSTCRDNLEPPNFHTNSATQEIHQKGVAEVIATSLALHCRVGDPRSLHNRQEFALLCWVLVEESQQ